MYHPRADIEHLYIKRENGGRGFIQQELSYKATTTGWKKYLETRSKRKNIQLVKKVINSLINSTSHRKK